jgi:transposase
MDEVTIIGVDLAKSVFQLHGAGPDGRVVFRKKLSRPQFRLFLERQAPCLVAMEACATSHYWGREIAAMGHEVRLIPPAYVKPFVKRHKNDAADAEAIAEAALRPNMRAVAVKSAEQQSLAMLLKTREMLVRQRTQLGNALRGHLMEYGVTAPVGRHCVRRLAERMEDPASGLPPLVIELVRLHLEQLGACDEKIAALDARLRTEARNDPDAVRLQTAPGIGPLNAMAIRAFAPEMGSFRRGRDFAAWLGLVPRQHSTGGRAKLGRVSKMGQRDIRRLLVIGAMSRIRWAERAEPAGRQHDPWLRQMLARKPRLLVAIALANKMARAVWAMMRKGEDYRAPATSA